MMYVLISMAALMAAWNLPVFPGLPVASVGKVRPGKRRMSAQRIRARKGFMARRGMSADDHFAVLSGGEGLGLSPGQTVLARRPTAADTVAAGVLLVTGDEETGYGIRVVRETGKDWMVCLDGDGEMHSVRKPDVAGLVVWPEPGL